MKDTPKIQQIRFPDSSYALDVARYFFELIRQTAQRKPAGIVLVLGGGKTPKEVYPHLTSLLNAERPLLEKLRWALSDERDIPPSHPESNLRLLRESLLHPLSASPSSVMSFRNERDEVDLPLANATLERWIAENFSVLCLLGVGEDGHTASLLPEDRESLQSDKHCVRPIKKIKGMDRVTLTPRFFEHSSNTVFIVNSPGKALVVSEALGPVRIIAQRGAQATFLFSESSLGNQTK